MEPLGWRGRAAEPDCIGQQFGERRGKLGDWPGKQPISERRVGGRANNLLLLCSQHGFKQLHGHPAAWAILLRTAAWLGQVQRGLDGRGRLLRQSLLTLRGAGCCCGLSAALPFSASRAHSGVHLHRCQPKPISLL